MKSADLVAERSIDAAFAPVSAASGTPRARLVVIVVGGRRCALPIEVTLEVTRPLAVEPIAGAPSFVLGATVLRGNATPVVDLAAIVHGEPAVAATRWICARVDDATNRRVVLAVDEVHGIVAVDRAALADVPPLLSGAPAEILSALGRLDDGLLRVLRLATVVPATVWARLEEARA